MIRVVQFSVGGFDANLSYVVYDDESNQTAIVDPAGNVRKLLQFISDSELKLKQVWLTHTHQDHFDALAEVTAEYEDVTISVHKLGKSAVKGDEVVAIEEETVLQLGTQQIQVMHTPGHSVDSVCFYVPKEAAAPGRPLLLSGDTVFVGGCGRTTAEGVAALYASLERIKALPPDTTIFPGHDYGHTSTASLSYELEHNPYLQTADIAAFTKLRLG